MPRFPKESRLIRKRDFEEVKGFGRRFSNLHFAIQWLKGDKKRLGIIIPKKVGKATQRNRIKRIIREYFRLYLDEFPQGDIIVIAKKESDDLDNFFLRNSLRDLVLKTKRDEIKTNIS